MVCIIWLGIIILGAFLLVQVILVNFQLCDSIRFRLLLVLLFLCFGVLFDSLWFYFVLLLIGVGMFWLFLLGRLVLILLGI